MLLINLFILNYYLIMAQTTINYIKTLPINDRTKEMVTFVGSNQKLARTLGQINFLTNCRKSNIMPSFILNKTANLIDYKKQRVAKQVLKLRKTLLNEEIRDAFRKKAFLQRSLTRSAKLLQNNSEEWPWLYNQGHEIFHQELLSVRHRLSKKFASLSLKQCHHETNSVSAGQCTDTNVEAVDLENDRRENLTEPVQTIQRSPGATTEADDKPTLVNLSHRTISDTLADLLGKGPKFALTQDVTPSILRSVETGIERAFYGLKWKHVHTKTQTTSVNRDPEANNTPSATTQPLENDAPSQDGMPRPFFPDSGACQPPIISKEGETKLEDVKSKIMRLYRGTRRNNNHNFTQAQKKELISLKKESDIIVKKSDKCKSLVIMDKADYISKAQTITSSYDVTTRNPTAKLEEETKELMKKTLKGKIPDDYFRKILPQHSRTAEFYGLPKTHKAGNPLRPIVSACGDPLDKLSWFLQCILTQILAFIPTHLPNTQAYLSRLRNVFPNGLPPKSIAFSIDVCNLYGSIPIHEGIQAVMRLIETNLAKINTYNISLPDIRSLLTHVLNNNYVRFNSMIFKQNSGIAMGNRLAPPVAIAFMHAFESSFLASITEKPIFYVRYIDDIFGIWTHGIDRLNHFFNLMNCHNPSIQLTLEHTEMTGKLAFLDTMLTIHPSGAYSTELYFKPMTAPIILHFTSAHPMSTKRAVLNAEIQRAMRVSSDQHAVDRSLNAITRLFIHNGYPENIIQRTIRTNKYNFRRGIHQEKHRHKKSTAHQNDRVYMRLPYINETIVRRVNGILRSCKAPIKPVWINENAIHTMLISSALTSPSCPSGNRHCHTCTNGLMNKCHTKNVIYKITCKLCEAMHLNVAYVGECTRPVRYRFNEHLSNARLRKVDTPLGEHILHAHTDISNSDVNKSFHIEILDKGKDCAEVKIKESIHIRNLKPSLNAMQSSWPLTRCSVSYT